MATTTTLQTIERRVIALETAVKGVALRLERVANENASKASSSDLTRSESILKDLIKDTNSIVSLLEQKLSKVLLPTDTRYYLEAGEVEDFQSNFQQLKAMMVQFQRLYKNLVAYSSQNS